MKPELPKFSSIKRSRKRPSEKNLDNLKTFSFKKSNDLFGTKVYLDVDEVSPDSISRNFAPPSNNQSNTKDTSKYLGFKSLGGKSNDRYASYSLALNLGAMDSQNIDN